MSDACPLCGVSLPAAADKAAHVCPLEGKHERDVTGADVAAAAEASHAEAARRAAIRPTKDRLLADAAQCAKDFIAGWDGEVECVIVLAPKGSGQSNIAFASYAVSNERRLQMLRVASERMRTTQLDLKRVKA